MDPEKVEGTDPKDQGTPTDDKSKEKDAQAQLPKTLKEFLALKPEYAQEYKDELQREGDRRATEAVKTREQKEREKAELEAKKKVLEKLPESEREKVEIIDAIKSLKDEIAELKKTRAKESFADKLKAHGIPAKYAEILPPDTDLVKAKEVYLEAFKEKDKGGDVNPKEDKDAPAPLTESEKKAAEAAGMTEKEYQEEREKRKKAAKEQGL